MSVISLDVTKNGSNHSWILYLVLIQNNLSTKKKYKKFKEEHIELKDGY